MKFFQTLAFSATLALSALAVTPSIVYPAPGAVIMPGASFNFKYQSIADYGTSSYNYTVWLYTTPPADFAPLNNYASGYFFGRFAEPNYPGNPSPQNRAPKQLTMPNFAKLGGGFGAGSQVEDATFYLTVLEEYATQQGSVGYKISLVYNEVRYNVTGAGQE
ncbi:hypothetical protein BDQ12DRAFT_711212 [Crucibulum laeve]|uniref:Uncharacterized protein n=1 Tax=Crucibulum laeve TaxID=68775 RepID=A0A5C3M756_9AGAR|nr:hypothetical protein BDQ12DRAFT_711212 [Crucibulum laeve]